MQSSGLQFPWAEDPSHLVLALAGDVMLGRLVNEHLDHVTPQYPWGNLLHFLHSSDLNLINLENVFTDCEEMVPKVFNFKAKPKHVQTLKEASIQAVNLANNHSLDYTEKGLLDTLRVLDQNGIVHIGAGPDLQSAKKPAKFDIKNFKIGILGATDNEPSWLAGRDHPGTFYLRVGDAKSIEQEIMALRNEVDLLILSIHWGPNMREVPTRSFVDFAHRLVDLGVDILHGHSAHIFQGVEVYKNSLILYDCGDFVDDYAVDDYLRNDFTFLFVVEIINRQHWKLYLIPAFISNFQVNRAMGEVQALIMKRMFSLSSQFKTPLIPKETPFPHLFLEAKSV